jgi:hypothetical protein
MQEDSKPILFVDFNGVLSYGWFWSSLQDSTHSLSEYLPKIQELVFKDKVGICDNWMRGHMTSEEVHRIIAERLDVSYESIWEIFQHDCIRLDVSIPILNALNLLKSKYKIILATDNMDSFDRFTRPANPKLETTFDVIHNSWPRRQLKWDNDGEYFAKQIDSQGVKAGDCLLIDDSRKVCDVFEGVGGKVFCVSGGSEVLGVLTQL